MRQGAGRWARIIAALRLGCRLSRRVGSAEVLIIKTERMQSQSAERFNRKFL
jgi:hypothetical protein